MSSNICTKKIDWGRYDVVYAGAQKNLGPAGLTVVIVKKDLLRQQLKNTPDMIDWDLFNKSQNTFYNTPCCWAIYVCGLNVQHLIARGGID